jgi:hypothetical protein
MVDCAFIALDKGSLSVGELIEGREILYVRVQGGSEGGRVEMYDPLLYLYFPGLGRGVVIGGE